MRHVRCRLFSWSRCSSSACHYCYGFWPELLGRPAPVSSVLSSAWGTTSSGSTGSRVFFLIDPWRHGWLIPLFVGGLAAILAVFSGLAAAAARSLAGRKPLALLLAFAAFWTFGEWLRGWVFTGFPWNLLGSVWLWSDPMVQLASVTGAWGLSLLTLLALGAPAIWVRATAPRWQRIAAVPIACLLLGATFLFGSGRLAGSAPASVDNVMLRLVQPNIPQTLKWDANLAQDHVLKLIRMSVAGDGPHQITDVIWPETAVPFALERSPGLANALTAAVPPAGLLITGIPRVSQTNGGPAWHNSMVALDGTGAVRASFDKFIWSVRRSIAVSAGSGCRSHRPR